MAPCGDGEKRVPVGHNALAERQIRTKRSGDQGRHAPPMPLLSLNYAGRTGSWGKFSDFFIPERWECVYFSYWRRWTNWWNRCHAFPMLPWVLVTSPSKG